MVVMIYPSLIDVRPEIAAALNEGRPVVALESTLIAHGLPWPFNLETAQEAEAVVRREGAIPATIAVWQGRPTVGLSEDELEQLAQDSQVMKASRRDLAVAVARGLTAATTVSATMFLAQQAGIRIFATGGIGGAHCGQEPWDISADLQELARTQVAVVSAGAKSILDMGRTLEILETFGVPVLGYQTDTFPAFYVRSSGLPVQARVDSAAEAADLMEAHWKLGGAGVVLARPASASVALEQEEFQQALACAENAAKEAGIRGPALTPFLLASLGKASKGKTWTANQALIVANAELAAKVVGKLKKTKL